MGIYIAESMPPQEIGLLVADQFASGADHVHLRGMSFHTMEEVARADYIRTVSSVIGELTLTNANVTSDVWRLDKTTSPSSARIPYHTDSPYYQQPEQIVGFWNVKTSNDGGENVLLPTADILDWASSSVEARELVDQLADPVQFTHEKHTGTGPMLDPETGIARFDRRYVVGEEAGKVATRFTQLLESNTLLGQSVKLEEGEVLFFNNQTLLHARETYTNTDRVSYRVRLNPSSPK